MTDLFLPTEPASPASFGAFEQTSPFQSTATEGFLERASNLIQPTQAVIGSTPPISPTLNENLQALQNKYAEFAPLINALPDDIRNALVDFDSQRIARGAKPLTRQETLGILRTVVNQTPDTPEPERSMLNLPGNFLSDLGTIVRSLPRIPATLFNELQSLGQPGEGSNIVSQLANTPGLRLLPGSFVVGSLAEGEADELLRHPLFTALDVLPFGSQAAKATGVGQAAIAAAEAAGKNPRPLAAALTQRLDESGNLVDRAPRAMLKRLRDETTVGVKLDSVFMARGRDTMREFEMARMKVFAEMQGLEPNPDRLAQVAERAIGLRDKYNLTDQDAAQLYSKLTTLDGSALTPDELAFRGEYKDLVNELGMYNVEQGDMIRFDGEFYPVEQGSELMSMQREAAHTNAVAALREEWSSQGTRFGPDDFSEFVDDALNRRDPKSERITRQQMFEFHAVINTMDAYGYEMADVRKLLRNLTRKSSAPQSALLEVADAIRTELNATDPATLVRRPNANMIAATLKKIRPTDRQVTRLEMAIATGNTAEVAKSLKNILKRAQRSGTFTPDFVDAVRRLRDQQAVDVMLRQYTRRRADLAKKKFTSKMDTTPPARFGPLIGRYTREGTTVRIRDAVRPGSYSTKRIGGAVDEFVAQTEIVSGRKLSPEEVEDVARRIVEEDWASFEFGDSLLDPADPKVAADPIGARSRVVANLYQGIEREVSQTWRFLRERGEEPVFVHTATKARVHATLHPAPGPLPVNLSQVQERAIDLTPGIKDPAVALSHQAVELLMRRSSEEALEHILQQHGIPEWELRQRYKVQARDAANTDPMWGFKGEIKDIIQKRYMPVDLNNLGFDWRSARLSKFNQTVHFVPRAVYEVLSQITNNPKTAFGPVMDKVTGVFRASVIGLSPRVQLYNILGGLTMLLGETGPSSLSYIRQAYDWAKDPSKIPSDQVLLRRIVGSQRKIMQDFDEGLTSLERQKKAQMNATLAGGKTLGRLWRQIQDSKAAKTAGGAVDYMYDLNARFDDMYRTMSYLYGYDKALTRGMSREVAERAGVELMQKVMMDWSGMTPIERSILKSVLPFYTFVNHSIRYVFRYPIDHPLRAAVVGTFGRAAQDDLEAGLPDRFLGAFFFGDRNERGEQNALNLTPFNPFGDVANMLTISGFLSQLNPVFATALEAVGLERGEAELYPSLRYNPETGRLEGVRSNPLIGFAQNVVPQSEMLFTLLGAKTNLEDQIRRDPAGAWRTIASSGGMPILWREYNVLQEQFKSELARQDSQTNALQAALRSGNWGEANRYPGLAGVQQRVQMLPDEVLQAYTIPEADAVRAQLEALLAGQTGAWSAPDPYQELIDAAVTPNPVAAQQTIGGI